MGEGRFEWRVLNFSHLVPNCLILYKCTRCIYNLHAQKIADPNQIENPWDMPKKFQSSEAPSWLRLLLRCRLMTGTGVHDGQDDQSHSLQLSGLMWLFSRVHIHLRMHI